MKKLPIWCKIAKKKMIDLDINVTELAAAIDKSRTHVSLALNGRYSREIVSLISDELNISDEWPEGGTDDA